MRQRTQYLYLEVKRTIGMFPRMLLQAILLMVLIGMIAFCGIKSMEKRLGAEALRPRIDIGLVVREDNMMTRMAVEYVENLESVAQTCRFVQVTEEEGRQMLEAGEVEALVILPEKIVEGIMNGQNPSVEIHFPDKNPGIETLMMRRLVETGVGLLRAAQAQSYGAYDTAAQYGMLSDLHDMERAIDKYNLEFALDRLEVFDGETVSATGQMSVWQYYAVSAMVLFLLLAGIAMYPAIQKEPASFVRQMQREGTGRAWQSFCKWLCGFLCMGLFVGSGWLFLQIGAAAVPGVDAEMVKISGGGSSQSPVVKAGIFLLVMITAATLIFLLYSLAGSRTSGVLIIFLVSVAMVYLSGGFVPSVFLPQTMALVGEKLPTAYMMSACGILFDAGGQMGSCVFGLCMYTAVFGMAAYMVRSREK